MGVGEIEVPLDAGAADAHAMRCLVHEVRPGQQGTQPSRIDATAGLAPQGVLALVGAEARRVALVVQIGDPASLHLLPDPYLGGIRIVQLRRQRGRGSSSSVGISPFRLAMFPAASQSLPARRTNVEPPLASAIQALPRLPE
jgi:hypothetical protein